MLPGKAQILTCPHCGTEKQMMSLLSGNTFGSTLWSDNKLDAPMLPTISLVQKCPKCGKFYIRTRQESRNGEDYSFDTGYLEYPEMKEAFVHLLEEGFLDEEESNIRFLLHHTFNDYFHRREEKDVPTEEFEFFKTNAQWLVDNCISDTIMKAEFYREMGDFVKATELIEPVDTEDNEFLSNIKQKIQDKIASEDSNVFMLRKG